MKKIKVKQTKKDVKVLDKASDVTRRVKDAYIRNKKKSERHRDNYDANFVNYADNIVSDRIKTVTEKSKYIAKKYIRKAMKKIEGRKMKSKDSSRFNAYNTDDSHSASQNNDKEIAKRNAIPKEIKQTVKQGAFFGREKGSPKQTKTQSPSKLMIMQNPSQSSMKKTVGRNFLLSKSDQLGKQETISGLTENALTRSFCPYDKKRYNAKQSAKTNVNIIKDSFKGKIKTVKKPIKTTKRTTKIAIKTIPEVVKTTVKTTQTNRKAVQIARAARKATATSTKVVIKTIKAVVKAVASVFKGTVALAAAGGGIALIIILVICLAGSLLGSVFGVFFPNENSGGDTPTITEVISQLNEEFYIKIEQIKSENFHDTLELSSNSGNSTTVSNWLEILPIYTVKMTNDYENTMDTITLDDTKIGILRGIFRDMNQVNYWIEAIEYKEIIISKDDDDNEVECTITNTETILHIDLISKTYTDMIAEYSFNSKQVRMLNELMQDKYQQLFMQLIEG